MRFDEPLCTDCLGAETDEEVVDVAGGVSEFARGVVVDLAKMFAKGVVESANGAVEVDVEEVTVVEVDVITEGIDGWTVESRLDVVRFRESTFFFFFFIFLFLFSERMERK